MGGRSARNASSATAVTSAASWADALINKQKGELLVCRTLADMRAVRQAMDALAYDNMHRPATVGFVPTMGALHEGHLGLVDRARANSVVGTGRADFVISSIFVNPTQFAPHEDLSKYPRTWETDVAKLKARGVDVVFAPLATEMYPPGSPYRSFVTLTDVDAATPEGSARPGFFRGVATVVSKLFNIVQPTHACFGQKDGVQCIVVRQMVRDMNLPVSVDVAPTARDADGLAMSSRNVYLSHDQRAAAPAIYKALSLARATYLASPEGRAWTAEVASRQSAGPAAIDPRHAETIAQQAAVAAGRAGVAAAAGGATSPRQPLEPVLSKITNLVCDVINKDGNGLFGDIQYVTFSDALTGAPLAKASDSLARNGAVMLSVAAKIGATRLLDNVMLVGTEADLGMPVTMGYGQPHGPLKA